MSAAVPRERKAAGLAFLCNFQLMATYYILRPVRDTVATLFGVAHLHELFTATFVGTLAASLLYTGLASRIRLTRLLPGVFGFWLANVLVFAALFRIAPGSRWLGAAYFVWFSVSNLFMISVFWSLMADVFCAGQAIHRFARIAAGGALGAIAGPLVTRLLVASVGLPGLLLIAAAGFGSVILLLLGLMREKERMLDGAGDSQQSTLDHALRGSIFDGFTALLQSRYIFAQAAFMFLMTWVNTVAYYCQTDLVARTYSGIAGRAQAIADISLVVNVGTAAILFLGVGRIVQRFGVTVGLILNPLLMVLAFFATALSPTLLMVQSLQVVRQVAQFAIARPSREICFTPLQQESRYKAKNVIDTVIYRLGDISAAWMQAAMHWTGYGFNGFVGAGMAASLLWGVSATYLGRLFNSRRSLVPIETHG